MIKIMMIVMMMIKMIKMIKIMIMMIKIMMMILMMIKMMIIHLSPDFQAGLSGSTVPRTSWSPWSLLFILYISYFFYNIVDMNKGGVVINRRALNLRIAQIGLSPNFATLVDLATKSK